MIPEFQESAMFKIVLIPVVMLLLGQFDVAQAKSSGHAAQQSASSSSSTLRGNSNDRKGGRYLARAIKKLPGKKKPPTVMLKGAAARTSPEKVEAGSENIRRVK
jgi:hypothetical protein